MNLEHQPGKDNVVADALLRRDQDRPHEGDDRLDSRVFQLLKPTVVPSDDEYLVTPILILSVRDRDVALPAGILDDTTETTNNEEPTPTTDNCTRTTPMGPLQGEALEQLWNEAVRTNKHYQHIVEAITSGKRTFPSPLKVKASISECTVNETGYAYYRERKWIPDNKQLRTSLIHGVHTSFGLTHPGRSVTYKTLARYYFWPGMSRDVTRYVDHCDDCSRTKVWRDGKQGYLRPLPVPDRTWQEILIDFITGLPESDGCTNLMVITDRLSKDVILIALPDIATETVLKAFMERVVHYHFVPRSIVSDRGAQFVSNLWRQFCEVTGIRQQLSTAFHPQTDGSTERMNSVIEAIMRIIVSYGQKNWASKLTHVAVAIKGREATSTKMTPFFITHGYEMDLSQLKDDRSERDLQQEPRVEGIASQLREVMDLAAANMANAQQEQEHQANRHRKESPNYMVGDKVWLYYGKHLSTVDRPCKKFDWKAAKYTVTQVVSPHSVRLNTPSGIHDVFHVDWLRLAHTNPLPSQPQNDSQPPPIHVDGEEEWEVEEIVAEKRHGRGRGSHLLYEVKWKGYSLTTWEEETHMADTEALDRWIDFTRPDRGARLALPQDFRRTIETTDGGLGQSSTKGSK
jgi:transposase InsO family protein